MNVHLILYWIIGLTVSVYLSLWAIKRSREFGYTFLTVLSAGYIVFANILTPRLIQLDFGITQLTIVTGSLIWPFTAQLADMINEIYGKRKTFRAFLLAYFINLLFVLFVFMAEQATPIWTSEEEVFWKNYFMPSGRILLASTISFIVCILIDVNIFSYLKEKYRPKEEISSLGQLSIFGALRSMLSDILNMFCDGLVFSVIAFAFVLPLDSLCQLIVGSVLFKAFLSLIDTPLFILFRIHIRNIKREK